MFKDSALIFLITYAIVMTVLSFRRAALHIKRSDELHRWHSYWEQSRRWLAEFPDAADALEHLKASAIGAEVSDIRDVREAMRTRRDVPAYTPEERQAAADFGILIGEPTMKAHTSGSAITSKRTPL